MNATAKNTATPDLDEWAWIPLKKVAELTTLSERSLKRDCQAGVFDHIYHHQQVFFTVEQFKALVEKVTRRATADPGVTAAQQEADELQAAREFNAGRSRRRAA